MLNFGTSYGKESTSFMLRYNLDVLGWDGFENLVQRLLKAHLGLGVECWGGSGDWGRDAYCEASLAYPAKEMSAGPFVFQCKFVDAANAAGAKPEPLVLAAVQKECELITKRLNSLPVKWEKPPTTYVLFTNACLAGW